MIGHNVRPVNTRPDDSVLTIRQVLLFIAAFVPAAACADIVDAPAPGQRTPLIEGILVAGRPPTLRVRWLRPDGVENALPDDVDLALVAENALPLRFQLSDRAGALYAAAALIEPGRRYQVEGAVGDVPISARTTVPSSFAVARPATDTVPIETIGGDATSIVEMPFEWRATGAVAFVVDSAFFSAGAPSSRATSGVLYAARRPTGAPPGPVIRILALNRDADGYLNGVPTPASNVNGGFGVLGGALEVRRILVWP